MQQTFDLSGGLFLFAESGLGYAYAMSGERDKALRIIDQFYQKSKHSYIGPGYFALIYIGLGEYERAMDFLERAYEPENRYLLLPFIKVAQEFDPLRSKHRFQVLMKKMNFPE